MSVCRALSKSSSKVQVVPTTGRSLLLPLFPVSGKVVKAKCRCAPDPRATSDDVFADANAKSFHEDPPGASPRRADLMDAHSMPFELIAGLASVGLLETMYLTMVKLLDTPLACPSEGCDSVLNSSYAYLFGLPLSVYGALAYGAVGIMAAAGMSQRAQGRQASSGITGGLAAGAALLATCSAALMYILFTRLDGAQCVWCYGSAALSFATLAAVGMGLDRRQMAEVAAPSLGSMGAAVLALWLGLGSGGESLARSADFELPYQKPLVSTEASPRSVDLARRLREAGARMYGAFWCSHCYDQKQVFGAGAMGEFPYVECYPSGWKKGVKIEQVCADAGVQAFPTWVIGGQIHEGALTLDQLEELLAKSSSK